MPVCDGSVALERFAARADGGKIGAAAMPSEAGRRRQRGSA